MWTFPREVTSNFRRQDGIAAYPIIEKSNIDQTNPYPIKLLSIGQFELAHFSRNAQPIESSRKCLILQSKKKH